MRFIEEFISLTENIKKITYLRMSMWIDYVSFYIQNLLDDVKKLTPVTGKTFTGEFDLTSVYSKTFLEYTTNTALTPTLKAGTNLKQAFNKVEINAQEGASLVPTNIGLPRPGSDTFTVGKLNEIVVMQDEVSSVNASGLWYSIKILN